MVLLCKKRGGFNLKKLAVFFEIVFVLSVLTVIAGYFKIEVVNDIRLWLYLIGGISFLISFILRKKIDPQEPDSKNI